MKSIRLGQILWATVGLFGALNIATMLPTTAQNSPSTPDSQLPPTSPTTPNSPTTPSSSPQTPNNTSTPEPTQTTSPTTPRNNTNIRKTPPRSKPGRNTPGSTTSPTPTSTTSPTPTSPKQSEKSVSSSAVDRQFAIKAAQGDMTEIQTSQLALNRSKNPQILKYAQEMIQAHKV